MSYLQTCKHKLCFQITHKFLNLPLSFTHSRATYILRHYTSQPASVGYGRMYTLHPPPKTLEGSTTTEKWLTCHHRCACASINKSEISKTQIGRWRRARHSRTYKHNQSCISKKRTCMHPCSMGCSAPRLQWQPTEIHEYICHIKGTHEPRVTLVTTSANPQPCFKMTTENSHSNYHSTDCTKARNAPLHTRDSNPFYSKNWLHGVRGQ